ncbi:MAG: RNA polymerase sigma factor [Bacteroidales bacterium]|nr:RNA polymerase sigma factor [Bacteroidales bacterium]
MLTIEREKQLVKAILDGDKQQFAEIVKAYQQIVANITYKLSGDRLDVEEICQQVFVELYTSLSRFRFESKLSTFIYSITVNLVNKALLQQRRIVSFDKAVIENEPGGHNEEEEIEKEERRRMLREAIGQLKPEQRTAVVLYSFEEFSYQEIADIMGVSLSKVESLIFRAKKNLKKIIENVKQ